MDKIGHSFATFIHSRTFQVTVISTMEHRKGGTMRNIAGAGEKNPPHRSDGTVK